MPRAYTGCTEILYTKVSPKALVILNSLAQEQNVSRALYLDRAIKKMGKMKTTFVRVNTPSYAPHSPVRRKRKSAR
jgi:hypothetical protein